MTVGARASTERKEDQREVRGKMTLTVEYSEMTAKIVKHFKITATTSVGVCVYVRACVCADTQ